MLGINLLGCPTKHPHRVPSTPQVQISAGTQPPQEQTEAGSTNQMFSTGPSRIQSAGDTCFLFPSRKDSTHFAIVGSGHVPLAHPIAIICVGIWSISNSFLHHRIKEETQMWTSTKDPSHCKSSFNRETGRQGAQLTADTVCPWPAIFVSVPY